MTPVLREMDAKEQESLYDDVESFAAKLDAKEQRPAVVSAMRLIGQLGRPQARRWLFKFVGAEQHPAVRAHALVALLRCLREQDIAQGRVREIVSYPRRAPAHGSDALDLGFARRPRAAGRFARAARQIDAEPAFRRAKIRATEKWATSARRRRCAPWSSNWAIPTIASATSPPARCAKFPMRAPR